MKKVLLAITGIIAIVTTAILLIVCVKNDDNDSSSNLNNITIANDNDFTSNWTAKAAGEGDYESTTTFEIKNDVTVSEQTLVVASGVTLRITNADSPVIIGSSADVLGKQLILKDTTITLMEQAKLILDVNVILDGSSIISGATEGDDYFYPNLEINDSVLLLNESTIDSTNFNSTAGVVVNGTLNLDGSNANLTSDENSPITLREKAMVIAIKGATISGKIEGNGGFVQDGNGNYDLGENIGRLDENFTVIDDLDEITAAGNYIVYNTFVDSYERASVDFAFKDNIYNSGKTTRIISFYDYLATGDQSAQFNVNENSTLELGGFTTTDQKIYQANTNKFIIDGGANWVSGSNVYFVTGDYDPYREGAIPETDNREAYNNEGVTKEWPILYVRKNSTANLFGGVVIQNVDNSTKGESHSDKAYGTINIWGETNNDRPKLNVYGATIRFNHANGNNNSRGGAAISASYAGADNTNEADIYIADCDISYNSVWGTSSNDGAAIGLFQNVNLVMADGVISHNHSSYKGDSDGGAIMVRDGSNLTMNGGTLSYNFVYGYGGAICIYSSSVTINSGNLIYNRASFGGGIASSGGSQNNRVKITLGASENSDLYVAYNEAFENDHQSGDGTTVGTGLGIGGGVALGNNGSDTDYMQNEDLTIKDGLFEYNKALYGGGIASYTINSSAGNKLYLQGGEIRNNNATNGAGLYIESNNGYIYEHTPLLYLSGSAKVDTSNNIQIKGNVSGQVPIEVTDELTASGIIGLISYVDTSLYQGNPNAVYFNGTPRQADKFLLDSADYCFVMYDDQDDQDDQNYIEIELSNGNQPYSIDGSTDNKKYSNLKAAVDAIGDNATATILVHRNVSLTAADLVTINNNKKITIKSAGDKPFTLAISKDFDFSSQDTSNPGILRINPGCELTLENINLDGNSSISDGFAFVYNTGTFTLGETASLNNNISNLNGGAINIQQSGSITNIYGTIYGNKGPNGAVYATGENITINIFKTAVIQNNTALSVNPTLGPTGSSMTVENVGLYLGAGVTCNFYGFNGLQDAIFYAGATLNITAEASVPNDKVNVYISNQFYTTGQIIFNVDASLKNTDFANQFVFANGLENDSFTNGSNNTIIINKVVKAIFDFESDAEGKGEVNLDFLTKDKLNELASSLKIDQSLVTKQGHKLVIYMDVNSQLSLEIIASRASMAGHKITGFTFNESTHALTENVPFYEVSSKFIANWEENSYTFTFSHQDFNDVMGEMTAVTYNYTTGFEGGSRNIPSNKFYVVGYYFAGWKVVGTDKVLANGQEIIASDMLGMSEALNDSTNITLLAIWKSIFSDENTSEGYRNGKSEATAFIISDVDGLNRLSHTVSQSDILSFDGNDYYNTTLENGSLKYQPFSYEGYYFKLSADFDNTNAPFSKTIGTAKIKADYNPDTSDPEEGLVAYLTNTYPFSGTFDGNYSDLTSTSGISVNVNINSTGDDFLGLFGYTKDATIKNLKVTGSVTGQNSIAGVTGFMNDGSLTNVVNEANINSTGYNAGGIVGTFYRAYTNSTNDNLINLVNNGNVTYTGNKTTDLEYRDGWKENKVLNGIEGTRYGGIVGQMWSGRINGGYNSGNIRARMAAGGIVGTMISMNDNSKDDSQINTALNIGNVTVTSGLLSDYQLEGTSFVQHNISAYAGGIAGRLFGASAITNVMNTANIEATYVGYTTNSSNISASSPLTHLVGKPTNMNAFYLGARGVGGIIGITSIEKEGSDFSGGNKSLEYAINTGHISGWSSVGGLVGLLAYSDVRYTINGGTIEAKGYHFIDGKTEVKGGTQVYDPSNNYKYYNYLGAIVGMAISANIDSTNYFDGDISYTGYTDAVAKATGDEVTSMGNGASTVAANKLASKELIVGTNNSKPSGLPETFFNTSWEYKTVLNTEENDYYYYPQLSALANNKILLKEVNVYKTIGELSMDGVILKAEDDGAIEPVEPSKQIIITLHLNDGYIDGKEINKEFTEGGHTYTYNDNGTLTLTIKFSATTGSIVLIDSKLVKYVGFNFGGWYKDNETFEEEFSGFLPSSNIDLYAKWEAINYNITYSGFGSYSDGDVKFDGDYVSSFTIENDTITLPTNVISGNGAFTFKRWIYSSGGEQFEATSFRINKDDNNTITIFVKNLDGTDHDPITIKIANLEFTLECEPEEYNIIYYDKDGKPLTEEELKNYNPIYTYTIRDNVTLPANVDRVGHKFIGWYTDKDLLTPATNIVRGTIGHQKFYAKFEPNNYTLTIDLGRMGSLSGDSLKFTLNGTEYTLVIDNTTYKVDIPYGTSLAGLLLDGTGLKDPTPITGYSFMHYSSTYDGDEFDPTDITMSEKGLTLYAVYETTKYKITIDLNDVLNDENQLQLPQTIDGLDRLYKEYKVNGYQLVLSGVEYHDNLEEALDLVLKAISTANSGILNSGWNFSTWKCPDGFSIYNVMGDKTEVSIKPIYLKHTFTWTILDKDLQTVGTITNKDKGFTEEFNSYAIYEQFRNSLVPAGYTYSGFYYLSDKNQNLIGDNLQITENCNIVVKLDPKKLPINFYDKDGKQITELKHNVYYQTEYGKLPEYSEPGYEFKGWSLVQNGSTIIQETDIVNVVDINNTPSINLYAIFELINYKITFTNLNGYQIEEDIFNPEFNIENNEQIELLDIINKFIEYKGYTGYRFSYFTDQDGNKYNSQAHIINVAKNLKDITLEAHFKAVKVLVIFNAGAGNFNVNKDDLADGIFVVDNLELQNVVNADEYDSYFKDLQDSIQGSTSDQPKYYITYVDYGSRPLSPQYPVLKGYVFNKWNKDIITITDNEEKREYEALYNANTYTISFITNNGETIKPLEGIKHNETVSETQVSFSEIKTGYDFKGWWYIISGTEDEQEFKFGETPVTSNLTLEAKWDPILYALTITVNHDIEGAKKVIEEVLNNDLDLSATFSGDTLTVSVPYEKDLSKLNNIFSSDGYDVNGTKYYFESYSNGTFTTMPKKGLVVTVSFTETKPKTVTIHYMSVKGANISELRTNDVSYTLANNSYSLENNSIYVIVEPGHTFEGWYSEYSNNALQQAVTSFTWSSDDAPEDLYLKYVAQELEIKLKYIDENAEVKTITLTAYYGNKLSDVITQTYKNNRPGYELLGFSEITNNEILEDSFVFTYNMALTYRDEPVTYGIKFKYTKPNGENIETGIFEIPYGEAIIYSEDYNETYYDLTWYLKNDQDSELFNEATMPNLGDLKYKSYLKEDGNIKYIVLYAQYTPTLYKVNFDTDGGDDLSSLTIDVSKGPYDLQVPTKEHYEFKSYTYGDTTFDKNKVNDVTFEELISLFKENEKEITLKANYDLKEYTLKLDDNNRLTFDYEDTSVTITWDDPTKEGATFLGYALTKDQKTAEFLKTIPVSELLKYLDDGVVTIYPVFSDLNKYQVMFIYETIDGIKTNSYQVEHGKTLEYDSTLGDLNDLGTPYRLGYEFIGWNENENARTGEPTEAIKQEKITKNTTYYAIFREKTYTIKFDLNGGNGTASVQTLKYTETITLPTDIEKPNYTFVGFTYNNNLYKDAVKVADLVTNDDIVITLEASYEEEVYTITFDSKGGSAVTSINVKFNDKAPVPTEPTRTGYTFLGWWYIISGTEDEQEFKFGETPVTSNLTLEAKWEAIKYTFTYDNSEQFKDVTIDGSIDLSQIKPKPIPGYDRYQFIINGKTYESVENVSVKDIVIDDSVTTYEIKLESIQNEYTIKFDQYNEPLYFKYKAVITGLPQANVKEGQEFVGWYYDDKLVANGDKISELVKDLESNGNGEYELSFTAKYDNKMIDGNKININGIGNIKALDDLKNTLRNKLDVHVDDDFSYKIEINDNNDGLKITYSARYNSDISFLNNILPSFIQYEENGVIHTLNLTGTGLSLTKQPATPSNKTISYTSSDIKVKINYDEKEDTIYPSLDENQKYKLDEAILKEKYNKVGYTIVGFYTNVNYTEDSKYTFGEESGSITLYIKYKENEYTIKYDGLEETTSFIYDSTNISITNNTPLKEGHTFTSWNTKNDGSGISYKSNDLITNDIINYLGDNNTITLYPQYSINSYIVTFDSKGGSNVKSISVNYGEKITKPDDPTKLGYEFEYWYQNDENQEFDFNKTMGSEPITLYAKWKANTNDIEFYDEEGQMLENLGKEYTYTYGKKLGDLYDYEVESHQEFIGWYYIVDEQKVYVDENTICTFITEGVLKLYAEVGTKTYYLNFEFNGGNGTYDKLVSFTGSSYTLPLVEDTNLTRTGYLFKGWKTSLNGDVVYENGDTITSNELTNNSLTLYASWEATTYEVKLHYEENTETITFTYDALNQIKAFSDLGWNKEGYTFVGWALAQDSDEVAYQDKANTLNDLFTQNKDLYAIFTPTTYTITLDLNGGSSSTLSVQIQTGDNLLEKLANITSTKTGYTFDYWMYNGEKISKDKTFDYDNDITLKANFKANNYTVTINLDGGASEGFIGSTISVTYDSPYNNLPNDPTKEGHTFVGWYLNNTLITEDSIVKVTDDEQTIVAKYNKNSYNVTFNTNGGSYVEGLEVTYGEKITKPDDPTNKLGYNFDGWYKDQNLEKEFNFETPMDSDSLTLYAKWKAVPYTITYNGLVGATYNDSNKTTYTVESDVTFGTPTKNGYRFVYWTLKEDGSSITSTKGYTGNLTVIANFEAITYHITYDLNGGTYEGANNLTYTVEAEVPFGTPTKPGYRFVNWTLEDGKVITSTKGYTKDLTVKANFAVNTYHISVKDHNEINPIEVTYGEAIKGLDELIVNKVGHNFTGFTYNNLVITNGMVYNYASDIEVEAQFSEIHYTIQFNANGGFGSVSSKNLSYNDEYVLPTTGYTKTGYKFIGWSKTNDGEVIKNQVSMLSSVDNSVVTLYAIYEAIEYEISFENSSEIIKIHYGDVISNLPTLKDNPSERFLGWSYNGVEIKDGMLYGYDSDIKLTANFEEKVYYIYLNALGGSLENSVIEMCYGDLIDLSKYIPQAPAGYNFIGWDLNETTMPDYNLNVKAKYEGIKYNIYFNANGANGNMTFQQATYGEPTKLKANQFTKDGYVFIGWSLSSNGEILYKDESYVNVKVGGLTLYAIFEEATYKINYNLAGGKVTNNPTTYTISSDYVFNKPTKEGYKFVGFYTEDGKLVESTLGLSGNLYLTAKYEAITYNITYTSDLSIDINLLPKVYSKDNVVNFDSLTKLGYEFVGWYLNGKLVTSTLNMTGDIKLEARFKIIEYKITYVLNGANNHQDNPLKYTIKDELTFKAPTKAGYTFNGWYISGTDTKVESIIGKTGDLVLEAHFTPEKVTVTFVDGNKEIEKVEIDYNSTISQITDPTKEGYVFNSWYLDGNKYDFSKPVTKDITLEAFYNKIALSTTIDNKVITVSSTSGKGLDPNYSLSVTKIVQELPLSNAIDLLYPLGDLVTLYDIKLLDKNGNIVDLGEDVKVTITDASLKEDVTYAVVHVTDDYLDYSSFGEYKVANNTISFVTPHFSMFGVVEVFEPINLTWLWVLIVLAVTAGFAFAIVVIVKNRKYQIKFVTNGGSLIAPMRLKEDALVELPNAINPGYRFKGWYLDEKLMKEAHFGSMPKENITLFAKWERDMDAPKSKQ